MKKLLSLSFVLFALFSFAGATQAASYYSSKGLTANSTLYPRTDVTVWNDTVYPIRVSYPVSMNVNPGAGEHVYSNDYNSSVTVQIVDMYNRLIFSGNVPNHFMVDIYVDAFNTYQYRIISP